VIAPRRPPSQEELEALIREARERQRRRWLIAAAGLAVAAALGIGSYFGLAGTGAANRHAGTNANSARALSLVRCQTSQLRISVIRTGAGLDHVTGYLAFANRSGTACALRGWPTLTAFRPGATTAALHARDVWAGPFLRGVPTVTLRHGQTAVAAFAAGDSGLGPTGACPPPFRHLRVAPPGKSATVVLRAWIRYSRRNLPDCTRIAVGVVLPASSMPPRGY